MTLIRQSLLLQIAKHKNRMAIKVLFVWLSN